MATYLFQLGREPKISTAEINAVFALQKISYLKIQETSKFLILETSKKINTEDLMQTLGGTIKIGKLLNKNNEKPEEIIVENILENQPEGKIVFSLNEKKLALKIKKMIKETGRNVRYVELKNSASILHNNLLERKSDFTKIDNQVFVTAVLQPLEEFGKRDYGKPGRDKYSGMLPPKLSKIMINLGQVNPDNKTFLDPFCGSGTVLLEAALSNFKNIFGSDISDKATKDSQTNLEWLQNEYGISNLRYSISKTDATKIDSVIKTNSIDLVVSEPFMGMPLRGSESREFLLKQAKDLKELYIKTFKALLKVLKKEGVIVFIIPSFSFGKEIIRIDCTKEIERLGFKTLPFGEDQSLLYRRPNQYVGRNIWRFVKK